MRTKQVSVSVKSTTDITPFAEETFTVPERVQRIDTGYTHGWQVRWQGTQFFSDNVYQGAGKALSAACAELHDRLKRNPPDNADKFLTRDMKRSPKKGKSEYVGIYGPLYNERMVVKAGRSTAVKKTEWCYSVYLPCVDLQGNRQHKQTSVHISTANTYTDKKQEVALSKAVRVREKALEKFRQVQAKLDKAALAEDLKLLKQLKMEYAT